MKFQTNHLAVLAAAALIAVPSLAMGDPVISPDPYCSAAPIGSSWVNIAFVEGPFGSPTDERFVCVYDAEQLLQGGEIRAEFGLSGADPPSRTRDADVIAAHIAVLNDGNNDVLVATVFGGQSLGPGSTGTGPADYSLAAMVNVTGKLESDSHPQGTNFQIPLQIDHDGGFSDPADVADFQNGSSLSILWSGQASVFTNGHTTQTSVFIGSLGVDEQSGAITPGGISGTGYNFTDTDGDGFFGEYTNTTLVFDHFGITVGEEFTLEIIVYASIFSDYNVDNPSDGDAMLENYFYNTFEIGLVLPEGTTFVPISTLTSGDANGDGKVDGLDYLVWAGAFGDDPAQDPPGPPDNGDFNEDGVVDGLDYLVWASNFGQGPNDSVAVPEPASLTTALLAVVGLLTATPRRRR